ncbi:MAG: hypothetical protein WC553_03645 [Patescibacteria group bacterium]
MSTIKQKFNSLIHRYPWALQVSLALVIALTAIGSSTNFAHAGSGRVEVIAPTEKVWFTGMSPASTMPILWTFESDTIVSSSTTADIWLQAQTTNGNWYNKLPIASSVLMNSNPTTYTWGLDDVAFAGERQRIAVIVSETSNGQTSKYTDYSNLLYIRQVGVHFITPSAGSRLGMHELYQVKFYWSDFVSPVTPFAVLEYKASDGSWQEITKKTYTAFLEDAIELRYFNWDTPISSEEFTSRLRLSLYTLDNDGAYTVLYDRAESDAFIIAPGIDFSATGIELVPQSNPAVTDSLTDVAVGLHFINRNLGITGLVKLYVSIQFYANNTSNETINPPVGDLITRTVTINTDSFDSQGDLTAVVEDVPILARYAYIRSHIDHDNSYLESDENNNWYPSDQPSFFEVPNYSSGIPIVGDPLSATYYSQKLTEGLVVNGIGPIRFDNFQANFSQTATDSDVDFAIGFFNASDQPVYNQTADGSSFDSEGYYLIPEADEYQLADGFNLPTTFFGQTSKANLVRSIRFRIFMASADITATDQPWVQSVTLQYTAADTTTIGVINFVDPAGTDGNVTKSIPRGGTGSFDIKITPMNDFVGQAVIRISAITQVGGNGDDVTGQILAIDIPQTVTIPTGITEVTTTVHFTVANDPTLSGVYQFELSGYDTQNSNAILTPTALGRINISGETGPFSLEITPTTTEVIRGQSTTYDITLTRADDFTGTVTLSHNLATIFGTGVTGTFFDDNTLSGSDTSATLTVTTTNSAALTDAQLFTVTGAATNQSDQIATAQLAIISSDDALTLTLTIPVEGGLPTDLTKPHPRFTVRIYDGLINKLERVGLSANAQGKVVLTTTRTTLPDKTYTIYARTTRHLWGKSTTPATLIIDSAHDSYTVTFPTLQAGDLDTNNKVNMQDISIDQTWAKYGQTLLDALGDFNNDGKININDISFITNFNYGKWGDQLPDETR